ncbi:MAG: exodeoxyribonuclease VII small subunit [Simkaniaceae bacterium]|nr:exodeoxyribonuclease VII small subunit [Candidatus Sacchlamyda saccharinae]
MKHEKTFEVAYERLEEILEKMNSEQVSLDESLALYEEADKLIGTCQKKLQDAEQKIEVLLKDREGAIKLDENGQPATEDFSTSNNSLL